MRLAAERRARLTARIAGNGGDLDPQEPGELDEQFQRESHAVTQAAEQLERLGVMVKDLDTGLVDFPALTRARKCCSAGSSARTRSPTGMAWTRASRAGNPSLSTNHGVAAISTSRPRLIVFGVVLLVTLIVAWLVDRRLQRRDLPPDTLTRYRVLRRSILTLIVFVGVLSALLVIPQVRAVATGILASSAVIGIIVGFAAQRTIGNFIAGLLIAFAQPVRIGDYVETEGVDGVVEEIGLTYTFIRIATTTGSWSRTRRSPRIPSATRPFAAERSSRT